MILGCHHIDKSFLEKPIIRDGSFHINEREKCALTGANGAGKSTLLKIITGEMAPDSGNVTLSKGASLGYLAQHQTPSGDSSILEEVSKAKGEIFALEKEMRHLENVLSYKEHVDENDEDLKNYHRLQERYENAGGYAARSEITGILFGLGFQEEDFHRPAASLSGGEKTRVALGRLLLEKPDVLLLDEPTNHLDISSITWLETYLINYPGAVLIVSHDRFFLDRVVTKVVEIENGELLMFEGNYSDFAEKKRFVREERLRTYLKQQQEIKHQEAVIDKLRSYNREKSVKRARSREKMLDRMQIIEKPAGETDEFEFSLSPARLSGKDVLSVSGLTKGFNGETLFEDLCFEIQRGEHVSIIGANGTGKTTLLKILTEKESSDAGSFTLGSHVEIGYYDQEHQVLDPDKTIFEEISDAYPFLTNTEIRNTLAAFLFTGDDVFKEIRKLSGGERGRVSLAKLMLSEANFLILDEPTNHLDIPSKEILEKAINNYSGTVLMVSHDRYFINKTSTRILELTGKTTVNYIGNYDYYLAKKDTLTKIYTSPDKAPEETDTASEGRLDWKAQKALEAEKRKAKNALQKTEKTIAKLEARDEEIDALLVKEEIFTNSVKLQDLSKEKKAIEESLSELYDTWETLAESL